MRLNRNCFFDAFALRGTHPPFPPEDWPENWVFTSIFAIFNMFLILFMYLLNHMYI